MSVLGNYVHYDRMNYYKYGIYKRQDEVSSSGEYHGAAVRNYITHKMQTRQEMKTYYKALQNELIKNNLQNLMLDQRNTNLDYGQKVNQFRSMLIKKAIGQNTGNYSKPLSGLTEEQCMQVKYKFDEIQHIINTKFKPGTLTAVEVNEMNEMARKYVKDLNLSAAGTSALGRVQQGLNDNAAKTWKEFLDQELGNKLITITKQRSIEVLKKALKKELDQIPNSTNTISVDETKATTYSTTDKTGSIYKLNATSNGWEIDSQLQRKYILKDIKNIYGQEAAYTGYSFKGESNLGSLLNILDQDDRFGTHWLNRHTGVMIETDLDESLMKAATLDALITGHNTGNETKDFVYLNRNTGEVVHKSLKNILSSSTINMNPLLTSIAFGNEWQGKTDVPSYNDAFTRIKVLLNQLRAIRLSVVVRGH